MIQDLSPTLQQLHALAIDLSDMQNAHKEALARFESDRRAILRAHLVTCPKCRKANELHAHDIIRNTVRFKPWTSDKCPFVPRELTNSLLGCPACGERFSILEHTDRDLIDIIARCDPPEDFFREVYHNECGCIRRVH